MRAHGEIDQCSDMPYDNSATRTSSEEIINTLYGTDSLRWRRRVGASEGPTSVGKFESFKFDAGGRSHSCISVQASLFNDKAFKVIVTC